MIYNAIIERMECTFKLSAEETGPIIGLLILYYKVENDSDL
jgi:hypothetical protein